MASSTASGFITSSFLGGLLRGRTLIFLPLVTFSLIKRLCTVGDTFAPTEIQYFTRSALISGFPKRALYEPSTSRNFPLFVEFFESVKTTRNDGSFFRPTLCSRTINIMSSNITDNEIKSNLRYASSIINRNTPRL